MKLQTKNAEDILKKLIDLLLLYLEELSEYKDTKEQQFEYGEKLAYTECLECIQLWEHANQNGLGFDIEKRYPL